MEIFVGLFLSYLHSYGADFSYNVLLIQLCVVLWLSLTTMGVYWPKLVIEMDRYVIKI